MKTIIVCGSMHSGTSLVTGSLRCLGIYMGDCYTNKHEDKLFSTNCWTTELLTYVSLRNAEYSVWGWKYPAMRNWFAGLFPYLRNPVFIYCYRSHTERAKLKPEKYDNRHMFCEHLEEGAYWGKFFREHQDAKLQVIEFNLSPDELLETLTKFLQLTPTAEQLKNYYEFHNKDRGYHALCQS